MENRVRFSYASLGLNIHFHLIGLDGVYAAGPDGAPEFHELPPPADEDVLEAVTLIAGRVHRMIERRGLEDEADTLVENDPGLAALYASAVRGRIASGPNAGNRVATVGGDRIDGDSLEAMSSPRCAAIAGFNLHGNVAIGPRDRTRLERLLRYAARPAVALERLSRLPDGRLVYRLKRMWSDGSMDVVYEPQDFMAKLAALVPAPRVHLTRFYGILAPAAKWRPWIVPKPSCDLQHNVAKAATLWFKNGTRVQPEPDRLHKLSAFIARPTCGKTMLPLWQNHHSSGSGGVARHRYGRPFYALLPHYRPLYALS